MPAALHLLKGSAGAALAAAAIALQVEAGDPVRVVLLHGASPPPLPPDVPVARVPEDLSYAGLLEAIYAAEHVVAW
jgi:hypothetical protein